MVQDDPTRDNHHVSDPSPQARTTLQAIVESVPIGVLVVDGHGTITFSNPEAGRQFGYSAAELLGSSIELLIPERMRAHHAADRSMYHRHVSHRDMGAGRHLTGLRKDGTEFPVEVGLTPFESGSGPMVMASTIDITVRKEAEMVAMEHDQRFRQVAESIREVFYLMDAELTETIYINPAYETVWGRTCESLYREPRSFIDSVSSPTDRSRLAASIAKVKRGIDPGELQFEVVRPDGEVRRVTTHATPMVNDQGEVYRVAGVSLDVTDRERALEAAAASERRLTKLFDTVNLIVLALDSRGYVEYVNPYFTRLTGYAAEEVVGCEWFETFLPPDSRNETRTLFDQLLAGAAPPHNHNPIVTKTGDQRIISWHNSVERGVDGGTTGTLSIGEDITNTLRLERQFQQAQKMEAVGRLAGGIAHDFNNVLTAISGYGQLVLDTLDDADDRREDMQAILDASASAAALTRQLLAFSRQQVVAPRVLNINDVVGGAERMLRRVIGEDVELNTALDPHLADVVADAGHLEQILMNLAVNARDAMPQGGRLTLETGNVELSDTDAWQQHPRLAGPHVLLAVTDNGIGMDEVTRSRIFEPFFTTKEVGKGTGLGLATVYGIVEQSNGSIWVYSEPGQGATFKMYFPSVASAERPTSLAAPSRPVGGAETILLIEDAANVRVITKQILTRAGYNVLEAPDGPSALAIAARHRDPIELLLTDIVMPEMSGRDAAEQISRIRDGIRILFMSGYTDDAVTRAGILQGDVQYLSKPFTADLLLEKVRHVLDQS